jgi:hypothetical protein
MRCTGWGAEVWTKMNFFNAEVCIVTEAYGSPKKCLLVCVWLLAAHLSKETAIFIDDDVQAAA